LAWPTQLLLSVNLIQWRNDKASMFGLLATPPSLAVPVALPRAPSPPVTLWASLPASASD
jgi:hypothetical protein